MREEDKMMVHTYFAIKEVEKRAWDYIMKGDDMNFHLLQTPKKVKPYSKTRFIYKPSVVSESVMLKPGDTVCVIGVTEGADAGSTAVKVMSHRKFGEHIYMAWGGSECNRLDDKQEGDAPCDCELPIEEMPASMKDHVFIVLLSDLGK